MNRICPHCREVIPAEATKCRYCHSLVRDLKICPQCAETVRESAKVCRFCNYDFEAAAAEKTPEALAAEAELPHTLTATPLGAMVCEKSITALFFPPEITINPSELHIRRWGLLGLRVYDQKISISKIASVRFISGVIWGGIVIETYGGGIPDLLIQGLDKSEARETVQLMEKYVLPLPKGSFRSGEKK